MSAVRGRISRYRHDVWVLREYPPMISILQAITFTCDACGDSEEQEYRIPEGGIYVRPVSPEGWMTVQSRGTHYCPRCFTTTPIRFRGEAEPVLCGGASR